MKGPYRKRCVQRPPHFSNFKPCGIPRKKLKRIVMTLDEYEAIRLADYLKLEHLEASEKMNISRPTFTRLIDRARQKIAYALIDGMELIIEGGNVDLKNTIYKCHNCGDIQETPPVRRRKNCPGCGSSNFEDLGAKHLHHNHG